MTWAYDRDTGRLVAQDARRGARWYQGLRYVEYEGLLNPRGAAHEARLLANDPNASFTLRLIP